MRKWTERLVLFIGTLLIAWFMLSYFNVIAHNEEAEPVYQTWNVFTLLEKII